MEDLWGYYHPDYACSLSEFGEPVELKRCGGWIIKRPIPGFPYRDGMGCYPVFTCRDWQQLHLDVDDLRDDLTAITMVTDPFADLELRDLQDCFEIVRPFKNHYIIDLSLPWENDIDRRHKQKIRKALKDIKIEISHDPASFIDAWTQLYGYLIQRHNITGIRTFSTDSFRKQLAIPGTVLFIGKLHGEVVGANLIFTKDRIAYDHLMAFSPTGYRCNAPYGIFWDTLTYLAEHNVNYCDLGAGAGLEPQSENGLDQFKRGWTKNRRLVYFCGHIYNSAAYEEICQQKGISNVDYFPAYRMGEFS